MYMDDDATVGSPLEDVVRSDDKAHNWEAH